MFLRLFLTVLFGLSFFHANAALGWWNEDWVNRNRIVVDTGAAGTDTRNGLAQVPVLVRLHTGNFAFVDAKLDGSDLRAIAADDRTPLKFHIEKWDGLNELAFVWVQVPVVAPGSPAEFFLYSGNDEAVGTEDSPGSWDASQVIAYHFADGETAPVDKTANANRIAEFTGQPNNQSLINGGLRFDGSGGMTIAQSASLNFGTAGFAISAWLKPGGVQQDAILFRQSAGATPLSIGIDGMTPYVRVGAQSIVAETQLSPDTWHHVAATVADRAVLFIDGQVVASGPAVMSASSGAVEVATRFAGELDEWLVSSVARNDDWIRFAAKSQAAGSQAVSVEQTETTEGGGGHSYFGILMGAVTLDGWVVIAILMVMLVYSFVIMIGKALFLSRTEKANAAFVNAFKKMGSELTALHAALSSNPERAQSSGLRSSCLYRVYTVGVDELSGRLKAAEERGHELSLTSQAIDAIRATIDAGMVRETHRLNNQMVLLTIAISGGPFLGLLGTVVGVMITFAAIAAAGDVNVNAIAPGIAAALVATVAGLAVAIPALFGYNYFASRIKNMTADMQVFADELITKLAESYSD